MASDSWRCFKEQLRPCGPFLIPWKLGTGITYRGACVAVDNIIAQPAKDILSGGQARAIEEIAEQP